MVSADLRDALISSFSLGIVAAIIAGAAVRYPGRVKFYLYGVPTTAVLSVYLVMLDACEHQKTCDNVPSAHFERFRQFVLARIAFSGICQDFTAWLFYIRQPAPGWKEWVGGYILFALLTFVVYYTVSAGEAQTYAAAGVGTFTNTFYFFYIVKEQVWGKEFEDLFQGTASIDNDEDGVWDVTKRQKDVHPHSKAPRIKMPIKSVLVTAFFMLTYIVAIGLTLDGFGPNVAAAVACVSPMFFVVVPLCMAIFKNERHTYRRKMRGIMCAISFNNCFMWWAYYGIGWSATSAGGYLPYILPAVVYVVFAAGNVIFLYELPKGTWTRQCGCLKCFRPKNDTRTYELVATKIHLKPTAPLKL